MKKAIGILFSDIHLDKDTIQINYSIYKQLNDLASKLEVKDLFGLGDFFNSRKAQPLEVLNTFGNILLTISKDKTLWMIPGNHDKTDYNSEDSYLDEFRFHPGIKLVRNFHEEKFLNNIKIWMVPYFEEDVTYLKYLQKVTEIVKKQKDYKHILLTHISIDGVSNNEEYKVVNNLKKYTFKNFEKVFVGHYHNSSKVGDNIYYIGSTDPRNYGENNEKGFTVLYDDCSFEFIKAKFKEYKKIIIDLNKISKEELDNKFKECFNKEGKVENNIRFEFIGDDSKLKALDKNKYEIAGIDVSMKSSNIVQGIEAAKNNEFISFNKKNIREEFKKFCEMNSIKNLEYGITKLEEILK